MVASTAAPKIVKQSETIHNLSVLHELRAERPGEPRAHSGAVDTDADTLCQNSDVAICGMQTSITQTVSDENR